MAPFHKPHTKRAVASMANRPKVKKWLLKLNKIFIEIELKRKVKHDD